MPSESEACRAHALRCTEIAEKAPTPEDRQEFLGFANSWENLADEIERSELLICLIDELATKNLTNENKQGELEEPGESQQSGTRSLRRLTAALLTISDHFIPDHFATRADDGEEIGQFGARMRAS